MSARIECSWCGKVLRAGDEPVSHGICTACEAHYFGAVDTRDDSATLATMEAGEKWWRVWKAGERARVSEVQARFNAFQRQELLETLGAMGLLTGIFVLLAVLLGI